MMNYQSVIVATMMGALLGGCAAENPTLPIQDNVDLAEYTGVWYEQALLPNHFQKKCVSDVSATYKLMENSQLQVVNRCKKADGSVSVAEGVGRLNRSITPPNSAILQVRFAPKWLSWLPMVWGNYWIIKTVDHYQYSLVGSPDRKYLWVLSREKNADSAVVNDLLEYAATLGFAIDEIKYTKQSIGLE